jgi:hypothetical protein
MYTSIKMMMTAVAIGIWFNPRSAVIGGLCLWPAILPSGLGLCRGVSCCSLELIGPADQHGVHRISLGNEVAVDLLPAPLVPSVPEPLELRNSRTITVAHRNLLPA